MRQSLAVLAACLCGVAAAQAGSIVYEDFTGPSWGNGAAVSGTNLPGGTWAVNTSWGDGQLVNYLGATAGRITVDEVAQLSLQSNPATGYVKPNWFYVEARLTSNCPGTDNDFRGGFIGFTDYTPAWNVRQQLYGIALRPADDTVALINNSAAVLRLPYAGGDLNANSYHTVSFFVDLTAGNIADVRVDGVGYAFPGGGFFTQARTAYLAFYAASAAAGGYYTWLDYVNVFPEPSAACLLMLAGAGLAGRRRRV